MAGTAAASNSVTQFSYSKSGSVLPKSSETGQINLPIGTDVDNYNMGMSVKAGPLKVSAGGNPALAGIQGAAMINTYAIQATGQAPPTPVFTLFRMIFGGNKKDKD